MAAMMLSEAIDEFIRFRKGSNYARNTITTNVRALSLFLRESGNVQMRHVDARHGDAYQALLLGNGLAAATVNLYMASVRAFVKWCHTRRYLPPTNNPLANVRATKSIPKERQRIDRQHFPRVLDCAHLVDANGDTIHGTAHDRIVVALGLYMCLRQSEIIGLRLGQVDLDRGEAVVTVFKTKDRSVMPICQEMDTELRRWLKWYANDVAESHGPLQQTWYLVPYRNPPKMRNDGTGKNGGRAVYLPVGNCVPDQPSLKPHRNAQRALLRFGMPLRGSDGKSNLEGVHTLRRSGARAFFDELVEESYDGALRTVAALLHHKHTKMTERYLGLGADEKRLMDLLKGRPMFKQDIGANVVPLHKVQDN